MIIFPDASRRAIVGNPRAVHRLTGGPNVWTAPRIKAERDGGMFRVEVDGFATYLRPAGAIYAGGGWPDGRATGFTLGKQDDDLVLKVWDVAACEPGPLYLPGVDG